MERQVPRVLRALRDSLVLKAMQVLRAQLDTQVLRV
jgi:hypothetical protein